MGKKIKGEKSAKKTENTDNEKSIANKDIKEKKSENIIKEQQDEKSQDSLKLVKKSVAVSYKKLKENHNKRLENKDINNLALESLKIIASNFDLDPLINFRLLSLLKEKNISEYNKYITKYKYTLNYEDAKNLKCFKDDVSKIIKESSAYYSGLKEIKSLSKVKLFNFLFYIMNLKFNEKQYTENFIQMAEEIRKNILSYENDANLIFKTSNTFFI